MVCFLEQNVSADAGVVQLFVVFDGCCGNVDIHAANRTVFVFDGINGFNAL